jgi:hypothetical protein
MFSSTRHLHDGGHRLTMLAQVLQAARGTHKIRRHSLSAKPINIKVVIGVAGHVAQFLLYLRWDMPPVHTH